MTKRTEKDKNGRKEELLSSLNLLILALLAFLASITFRRSAGIIAMTPFAFALCAASAFVKCSITTKLFMFGVSVFILNTVENPSLTSALIHTALCLLAVIGFHYGIGAVKKNKIKGISVTTATAAVCIILSLIFIGNPIAAVKANAKISEYTKENYPQTENSVLGSFEFSKIYYDTETRSYAVDAHSSKFPTEGAAISVKRDQLNDGIYEMMESKVSEPYILEMTSVLREAFPNESFEVSFDGFASLPDEKLLFADEGELYDNVRYEIFIGGVQTADAMLESVSLYTDAIDKADMEYASIVFKSGIGTWITRSVTGDPHHLIYHGNARIRYTSVLVSNRFAEFIGKTIIDN